MRSRILFASLLSLVFLAILATLGYRVSMIYLRGTAVDRLFKQYYGGQQHAPHAEQVDQQVTELRRATNKYGGERLEAMLVDRLAFQAWYAPDESVEPLSEILRRAPKLTVSEDGCPLVQSSGYMLLWSELSAGLPNQVEALAPQVIARSPQMRMTVRNVQALSRLGSGNIEGVRALAEQELQARSGSYDAEAFAMSCYTLLGDFAEGEKYSRSIDQTYIRDPNIKLQYFNLLMQQQDFEKAAEVMQQVAAENSGADMQLYLAMPLYALYGKQAPCTSMALKKARQNKREKLSADGVEARVLGRLFEVTGDKAYQEQLQALAKAAPQDFDVWFAQADSAMNRAMWLNDEPSSKFMQSAAAEREAELLAAGKPELAPKVVAPPLPGYFCQQALAHAGELSQQQWAELAAARSVFYLDSDNPDTRDKSRSLLHFRAALGDPEVDGAVLSERVPPYEVYILDKRVIAERDRDDEFSEGVSDVLDDYLERRYEIFEPALEEGEADLEREEERKERRQPRRK